MLSKIPVLVPQHTVASLDELNAPVIIARFLDYNLEKAEKAVRSAKQIPILPNPKYRHGQLTYWRNVVSAIKWLKVQNRGKRGT